MLAGFVFEEEKMAREAEAQIGLQLRTWLLAFHTLACVSCLRIWSRDPADGQILY